jgi:hypothetical protein
VDNEQLNYLIEKMRYLISNDSCYSYRMSNYADIKALYQLYLCVIVRDV